MAGFITHPGRASYPQDSHRAYRTVLHEVTNMAFPLQLVKGPTIKFGVIYGKQIELGLTYEQAAERFGYCLMHNLAASGLLEK